MCLFEEELDKRKCQYLKVMNAGFVDIFDAKLGPVFDADQCQARCVAWADGTCRSYTYDSASQTCYISHSTSRALGKNPLDIRQKHLTTADLDNCVDCEHSSAHENRRDKHAVAYFQLI